MECRREGPDIGAHCKHFAHLFAMKRLMKHTRIPNNSIERSMRRASFRIRA
jgi:hypothetical protein